MSAIGSGRGRGWMKLAKNNESTRPGDDLNKLEPSQTQIIPQEKNTYDDLIQQFECLDPKDDGIVLNEKIKHIRNVFMNSCTTRDEITKAVQSIHRRCLRDEQFIEKFVMLLTSAFFLNKQTSEAQLMWRDTIRKLFFNHLQENFENRELLRKTTPTMFYNSLKLYSCFFMNCRKVRPEGYPSVETVAITGFLDMLIEYDDPVDIKMFAHLVCENCGILMKLYDEKNINLLEVLDKMKLRICDNKLPKNQKFLLFFLWDLVRHKYNLSAEDLTFYRNNLEEDDIKDILIRYNYLHKLDIECPEVKNGKNTEDQGNHASLEEEHCINPSLKLQPTNQRTIKHPEENVLNLSKNTFTQQNISTSEKLHSLNNSLNSRVTTDQAYSSKYKDSLSAQNGSWDSGVDQINKPMKSFNINGNKEFSNKSVDQNSHHNQGDKVGRPILGIGARLKRN